MGFRSTQEVRPTLKVPHKRINASHFFLHERHGPHPLGVLLYANKAHSPSMPISALKRDSLPHLAGKEIGIAETK